MSDLDFQKLVYATRIVSGTTRYFEQVMEWDSKRKTLLIQLADIPNLLAAHQTRKHEPYPDDTRIKLVDFTPTMRLANACEATANGLYSMAEVAANFANKVSGGSLPTSFNALRKKCAGTSGSEVALALGDLQWYRKVRELRTEWAHYSSIFMAEDEAGGTILCVRAYRRPSDKVEFKAEKFSCTIDDFIGWVRNALATLDRFAGFLLKRYVVTTFALDATFTSAVLDKNGFPIIKEDHRFTVETISIREYLKRGGIVVEGY